MIPLLIGLGALVGGYLVVTNWQEIEGWLKEFLPKLQAVLRRPASLIMRQNFSPASKAT